MQKQDCPVGWQKCTGVVVHPGHCEQNHKRAKLEISTTISVAEKHLLNDSRWVLPMAAAVGMLQPRLQERLNCWGLLLLLSFTVTKADPLSLNGLAWIVKVLASILYKHVFRGGGNNIDPQDEAAGIPRLFWLQGPVGLFLRITDFWFCPNPLCL